MFKCPPTQHPPPFHPPPQNFLDQLREMKGLLETT